MNKKNKYPIRQAISIILGLIVPVLTFSQTSEALEAGFEIEGNWYGLPEAELFEEEYNGPPVVGEFITKLPHIAVLPEGNQVHQVRMDILAQEIEIGEGIRYQAWTFGGTVPGPVLHVREGDKVEFTMKNRSGDSVNITAPMEGGGMFFAQLRQTNRQKPKGVEMPMLHSIDFHSATVAANDKWRNVPPGMSIRFDWMANYPGVFIYHCGTPPVLQHMSMGQYGMVVVSPREGYPTDTAVDKSFTIVQSEFYLKQLPGQEGIYELDFEAALQKQPLVVAFNGHQYALTDQPLQVAPGDRVRLYVLNIGPNDGTSLHVIGAIFDRVWYEGSLENEWRGMQTVYLGASNGAVVEFIVPEQGEYVLVDHEMADAQKGAMGLIIAKPER